MKKKFMTAFLCVVLVIAQITALAASFPDVDASKYDWAIQPIQEMADQKIINGFPDGTFRPEEAVTRIDALLLISRILGAEEEAESGFLDAAENTYFADVNVIGYPDYQKNLAYLLYRGLYTPQELRSFLSGGVGGQALKRHEAAILLTKAMGAEDIVKANTMPVLSYSDASSIPTASKAYVEYCYETKLMQGMEDNKFNPLFDVTRAQMAVMLYNAMNKMALTSSRGTIVEVSQFNNSIKYTEESGTTRTINLVSTVPTKFNGEDLESLENVKQGDEINVIYSDNQMNFIEILTVVQDEVVEGIYSGKVVTSSSTKINMYPLDDPNQVREFIVADDAVVMINGNVSSVDKLTRDDHIIVTVQDGKATLIEAKNKEEQISGYISEFVYDDPAQMKIRMSNDEIMTYNLASNVTVQRNGEESDVRSLLVGDRVNITLEYGIIKKIDATSTTQTLEGTIEEIVISQNPSIKIKTDNETIECALLTTLDITINGEECDVYDLKLGYEAIVTMESSTVTKIEVNSTPPVETLNVVGTVQHVDTNYMFISLETTNGTQQIFVKQNATIIDGQTQKSRTLDSIQVGSSITAVISSDGFVPEAISIVILTEPK